MSTFAQKLARAWTWRRKIDAVLNVPRRSNSVLSGTSEELVVRVDQRTPSPTAPVDKVRLLSNESDVMVSGERFGISREDLTAIGDKMKTALERVEQMSRADDESFEEIMNVIERQTSLLYEEYYKLIEKSTSEDEGRIMDFVDSEVTMYFPLADYDFDKYLAAQEAEKACAAIKQKIDNILTYLDQLE